MAVEFQAQVVNGTIEIPPSIRDQVSGEVNVILFAKGTEDHPSTWPSQNRRRWQLIAKKARQPLTDAETEELSALQNLADGQLASVGSRPTEQLQQFYAELSKQD